MFPNILSRRGNFVVWLGIRVTYVQDYRVQVPAGDLKMTFFKPNHLYIELFHLVFIKLNNFIYDFCAPCRKNITLLPTKTTECIGWFLLLTEVTKEYSNQWRFVRKKLV